MRRLTITETATRLPSFASDPERYENEIMLRTLDELIRRRKWQSWLALKDAIARGALSRRGPRLVWSRPAVE